MNTVADGLASLSFHQGKNNKDGRQTVDIPKKVKGRRQYSVTVKYRNAKKKRKKCCL